MAYKLFTDKNQDFECKLHLDGVSLKDTKSRIVIESQNVNLTFNGTIDKFGKCIIPINNLGKTLKEGKTGLMRLEVLAGDIYFQPWKSAFVVKTAKKLEVKMADFFEPEQEVEDVTDVLMEIKGNVQNIAENQQKSQQIIQEEIKDEVQYQFNNIKTEINSLSKKVNYLTQTDDEKYDNSLEKWSVTNNSDSLNEEKIDEKDNYIDIVDNWSSSTNINPLNENLTDSLDVDASDVQKMLHHLLEDDNKEVTK